MYGKGPEYELICSYSQLIPCNLILTAGKTDTLTYLKKRLNIGESRSLTVFMNDLS